MDSFIYDIVIIGGGASGLMLAANLDLGEREAYGIVLEGSRRLGSKLLMSGGGRCNLTHAGSIKDFVNCYGSAGPALRRCLYRHSNLEMMKWFEGLGVELTDEDGRIFPASMKSRDVLDALTGEAARNMWQIETDVKAGGLARSKAPDGDPVWEISLKDRGPVYARIVVAAAGGITYPETGSDGSMLEILRGLGVEINEPRPALAPVYVNDYPYSDLSGISIPDVTVTAFGSDAACTCSGKAGRMTGNILFTREGFSGPAILNVSRYAEPGQTIRLQYNKELSDLPKRMQRILKDRARGESGDVRTKKLASLLDHDDFTVASVDRRGMVTAGGVALSEIDLNTMQLKSFANENAYAQGTGALYVIGEAIDADGITGGYNLQLCWSTALTAAESIASDLRL